MIAGLGLDILSMERFAEVYAQHAPRLPRRLLCAQELQGYQALAHEGDRLHYLARAFCAKEAIAKALGTGMGAGVRWSQISLQHRKGHRLRVDLSGAAESWRQKRGGGDIWLSFSSERTYLSAVAVLEREQ